MTIIEKLKKIEYLLIQIFIYNDCIDSSKLVFISADHSN